MAATKPDYIRISEVAPKDWIILAGEPRFVIKVTLREDGYTELLTRLTKRPNKTTRRFVRPNNWPVSRG